MCVCVLICNVYSRYESTSISFYINENKTCSSLLAFVYVYVICYI